MGYPQGNGSSLLPNRLRQWLNPERSCGKACWKNSSPVREVWAVSITSAYLLVRQGEDMLEHQQADHEPRLDRRTALGVVEWGDLAFDPGPVDLPSELHELVLR